MRRALSLAALAAALAVPSFTYATSAQAQAQSSRGVLVPARGQGALPVHGGTTDSLNWSGYAVTGSGISGVSGTFVVPTAGDTPPGFAATWAGIGGYSTSDLIQAGVEEDSAPSNSLLGDQYTAWYELLPASETPISGCTGSSDCTVNPGDHVSVTITSTGSNEWSISMSSSGTDNWTWSTTVPYTSSESSAEWILEAPTLVAAQTLIAPVGTVSFGPTSTWNDASGSGQTIAAGKPTQIVLSPGAVDEATPSALASNGESFNDCAYAQSCAAP
jgi:hypothetical protein